MIFIFNKNSILLNLIASVLGIVKCKVLITSPSKSFFLKQLIKLDINIQSKSLLYLDMSSQNIKDISVIDGDWNKVSENCVENLYKSVDVSNDLRIFFPNVKDLKKKLRLIVYQHFDALVSSQQVIITWIKSSIYKDSIMVNFLALKPGAKCVWKSSNLRVFFIFNYLNFFISILVKMLLAFTNYLIKKVSSELKSKPKKKYLINQFLENTNFHKNEVLFFPHGGVVGAGHPPKDHFYSNEIDSPFHPSKIIHLEYDNRTDMNLEIERMKKYLRSNYIYYKRFVKGNISFFNIIRLIIKIFSIKKLFDYKNIKSNFLYYSLVVYTYATFIGYRSSLTHYKEAKIALVGYDILFPKALAFALESLNIKTISITERFILIYSNNYTFSLDTLLSASESSSKIIKKSDRFLTNNLYSVGQVRTDKFFYKDIPKSKYKARVVVLDHHIENDSENQKFEPILNWKNDVNYRNEILFLAELNPEIEFIFRGKNCSWYNNKYHHHIKTKADKLPNVSVDMDYSINSWKSYNLCASADLIIARPTSLAEECVSKGMDVIVMDYGINYTISVAKFSPKLLRKYYCHSSKHFIEMFEFWKEHGYVITKKLKDQIKSEIFSNLTDGKVKQRVQKYLNKAYLLPK